MSCSRWHGSSTSGSCGVADLGWCARRGQVPEAAERSVVESRAGCADRRSVPVVEKSAVHRRRSSHRSGWGRWPGRSSDCSRSESRGRTRTPCGARRLGPFFRRSRRRCRHTAGRRAPLKDRQRRRARGGVVRVPLAGLAELILDRTAMAGVRCRMVGSGATGRWTRARQGAQRRWVAIRNIGGAFDSVGWTTVERGAPFAC